MKISKWPNNNVFAVRYVSSSEHLVDAFNYFELVKQIYGEIVKYSALRATINTSID